MSTLRKDRIAKNEAVFREVNERIGGLTPDQLQSFEIVCECGDGECYQSLETSSADYVRVRANATHFFVVPGHEIPDVESVIESSTRFNVVVKHPDEQRIAIDADRRLDSAAEDTS